MLLAARFACLARVTALAAMVCAQLPPLEVTSPVWAGIAAHGKPVALVRTSAEGVPRAGVTNVGEVASTMLPLPVVVAAISCFNEFDATATALVGTTAPLTPATVCELLVPDKSPPAVKPLALEALSTVPANERLVPRVMASGAAGLPVGLPCELLAAKFACLARVTALAAIVVANEPALFVTSPVCAGSCAACSVPVTSVVSESASRVLNCATVQAIGVVGEPVLLHSTELAARLACFARVTAPATTVCELLVPERSPPAVKPLPPAALSTVPLNERFVPSVQSSSAAVPPVGLQGMVTVGWV